jgi:hypothetical protein
VGFRSDSSCRSLARRRLSFVLPDRLKDGVGGGIAFAVGGVVVSADSLVNPLTLWGSSLAGDAAREWPVGRADIAFGRVLEEEFITTDRLGPDRQGWVDKEDHSKDANSQGLRKREIFKNDGQNRNNSN